MVAPSSSECLSRSFQVTWTRLRSSKLLVLTCWSAKFHSQPRRYRRGTLILQRSASCACSKSSKLSSVRSSANVQARTNSHSFAWSLTIVVIYSAGTSPLVACTSWHSVVIVCKRVPSIFMSRKAAKQLLRMKTSTRVYQFRRLTSRSPLLYSEPILVSTNREACTLCLLSHRTALAPSSAS